MPEEKIIALYDLVASEIVLNENSLHKINLTDEEIKLLCNIDIIKANGNKYDFLDYHGMYLYGLKILKNYTGKKDIIKAINCFKKYLESEPNNQACILQLFLCNVRIRRFNSAFKYYVLLDRNAHKGIVKELNLYLFLLNDLIDLPEEYKKYLASLSSNDYLIDENNPSYSNIDLQNSLRISILEKEYREAYKIVQSKDYWYAKKPEDYFRSCLTEITQRIIQRYTSVLNLLKNGLHGACLKIYQDNLQQGKLEPEEYIAYLLLKKLIHADANDIADDNISPELKELYKAIKEDNYELALSIANIIDLKDCKFIIEFLLNKLIANAQKVLNNQEGTELLNKYREKVANEGLVFLEPMPDELIEKLQLAASDDESIKVKIIKNSYPKKSIPYLVFIDKTMKYNEIREERSTGYRFYFSGDYEKSTEHLRKVIASGKAVVKDYSLLGLGYLRQNKTYLTVTYLRMATYLSEMNGGIYDYTDLINKILRKDRGTAPKDSADQKKFVKVKESEFDSLDKFSKVRNLRIVIYLMQSGMDVLEACSHAELNITEILMVYLVLAKEFYMLGDIKLGDYYLKCVRESRNKTPEIVKELNSIEKNKVLIVNRTDSEDKIFGGLKRVKPPKIPN